MIKEDVQWMALALGILVIIAFVVAPVATGQPPNLGISLNFTLPSLPPLQTVTVVTTPLVTTLPTTIPVTTPAPELTTLPPTPVPTWNASAVQTIQFVDPSSYGLNLSDINPMGSRMPFDNASIRSNLTTYATFSGQFSGTTQTLSIPFPYWELWYTVEPFGTFTREGTQTTARPAVTSTGGVSSSGYQGSYRGTLPTFTIQVMEANKTARLVREVTPMGGIDPTLWTTDVKDRFGTVIVKASDPRPWKERFYEGQRSYYFVIQQSSIRSYKIDIRVPSSYIGKP
jgi:hypothetical protein